MKSFSESLQERRNLKLAEHAFRLMAEVGINPADYVEWLESEAVHLSPVDFQKQSLAWVKQRLTVVEFSLWPFGKKKAADPAAGGQPAQPQQPGLMDKLKNWWNQPEVPMGKLAPVSVALKALQDLSHRSNVISKHLGDFNFTQTLQSLIGAIHEFTQRYPTPDQMTQQGGQGTGAPAGAGGPAPTTTSTVATNAGSAPPGSTGTTVVGAGTGGTPPDGTGTTTVSAGTGGPAPGTGTVTVGATGLPTGATGTTTVTAGAPGGAPGTGTVTVDPTTGRPITTSWHTPRGPRLHESFSGVFEQKILELKTQRLFSEASRLGISPNEIVQWYIERGQYLEGDQFVEGFGDWLGKKWHQFSRGLLGGKGWDAAGEDWEVNKAKQQAKAAQDALYQWAGRPDSDIGEKDQELKKQIDQMLQILQKVVTGLEAPAAQEKAQGGKAPDAGGGGAQGGGEDPAANAEDQAPPTTTDPKQEVANFLDQPSNQKGSWKYAYQQAVQANPELRTKIEAELGKILTTLTGKARTKALANLGSQHGIQIQRKPAAPAPADATGAGVTNPPTPGSGDGDTPMGTNVPGHEIVPSWAVYRGPLVKEDVFFSWLRKKK